MKLAEMSLKGRIKQMVDAEGSISIADINLKLCNYSAEQVTEALNKLVQERKVRRCGKIISRPLKSMHGVVSSRLWNKHLFA